MLRPGVSKRGEKEPGNEPLCREGLAPPSSATSVCQSLFPKQAPMACDVTQQ